MKTNTRQPNPALKRNTSNAEKVKNNLHKYIALGGHPRNFEGCQGVTPTTVPGYKGRH